MSAARLASLVALRLDGDPTICPAWIESADRRCGKPATIGLLCARHHKVAIVRAEKQSAKDAAARERAAVRREAKRPAALARLEKVEALLSQLLGEPTTDTAVVNIPRSAKAWSRLDSQTAEVARLYREREELLWARGESQ